MHTFTRISILCLLSVWHASYGQDDFFEVFDFDTFSNDIEENLLKDRGDIFKEKPENTDVRLTSDTFNDLCEEYEILLDNQRIDCNRITLNQRKPIVTPHVVQKRQAEETELEGSGNGDEAPQAEEDKQQSPDAEEPQAEPKEEQESDPPASEPDANPIDLKETEPNQDGNEVEETATEEHKAPLESVGEVAKEDNATQSPDDAVKENPEPEATESPAEKEEEATEDPSIATTVAIVAAKEGEEETVVEEDLANQETTTVAGVVKKGRKLLPSSADTDKSQKKEEETYKESVQENQSGNAVVESPDGTTMEQHEKVEKSMAASATIKEGNSTGDEPKSGQSAKEAEEGRKDTKVLIILFVAVVVVGGAAFAYNFIKKRKQKKAHAAAEQNGDGNVLKRSLQNLSGQNAKSDPEQGTEMKPLMRPAAEKPAVEYKDEKENANTNSTGGK